MSVQFMDSGSQVRQLRPGNAKGDLIKLISTAPRRGCIAYRAESKQRCCLGVAAL